MIRNQNILATLMIFSSQLKKIKKSFTQKRQTFKTAIAEHFSIISNTKKISNKKFHHCEANIFFLRKLQNLYILKQTSNLQVMIA